MSLFGRALADENDPSQKVRNAIDLLRSRALCSRRIATVEPVFANIRHHKRAPRGERRVKASLARPHRSRLPASLRSQYDVRTLCA